MIRALARCIVLLALTLGVAACGQKGPLVLPDKADEQKQQEEKKPADASHAPKAPEPGR